MEMSCDADLCQLLRHLLKSLNSDLNGDATQNILAICTKHTSSSTWSDTSGHVGVIPFLLRVVSSSLDSKLRVQALDVLHWSVIGHTLNQSAAAAAGAVEILVGLVADSSDPALQVSALTALGSVVFTHQHNSSAAAAAGAIDVVSSFLTQDANPDVLLAAAETLQQLTNACNVDSSVSAPALCTEQRVRLQRRLQQFCSGGAVSDVERYVRKALRDISFSEPTSAAPCANAIPAAPAATPPHASPTPASDDIARFPSPSIPSHEDAPSTPTTAITTLLSPPEVSQRYHDDAVQGQSLPPSGGNKFRDVCRVLIVVAMLVTLLFVLAAVLGPLAVALCILARFINTPTYPLECKERKGGGETAVHRSTMLEREQFEREQLEYLESTLSLSCQSESQPPRAVAALFYMDDMESCECASLRVIVIEPVALVSTRSTKASDCNHDETANVAGAILSFAFFMMQSYNAEAVSSERAVPLASQSFDERIDCQEYLRLLFFVTVCQVRYGKFFKESSASLLALVLVLGVQYLLFHIFTELVSKCTEDFQAFRLPYAIISIALSISASTIMFFSHLLCFPSAFSFFKRCLDFVPEIAGGPRALEFSCGNMSRVMKLREDRRQNKSDSKTNDCITSVGHYYIECTLKYCAYVGLDGVYNSTKARQALFQGLKRIRLCLTCCGHALAGLAFSSSIPQLEAFCQETPALMEIASRARVWLSCDCIVNVASVAASYLLPLTNVSKVFAHSVTVLGISYLWLRPAFNWVHPLLSKFDGMTRLMKKFFDYLQELSAPLRSVTAELFKKMPVVLQGFEFFKKVEKIDIDPNKIQKIDKDKQSYLKKVRRWMEHPMLQRLWSRIKMFLKVGAVAACVGAVLLFIGKWPWTALEHVSVGSCS
jgi:hypothetical protein